MFRRKKVAFLAALIFSVTLLINPVASQTPPVATFTYTPERPIFGEVVIFNASASHDPDGGNISSYKWDFDDGTVYTISDPVTHHNYTAFGTYNVTLTVTDDEGETATTWRSVTVREYPVTVFTYTPERPVAGYPVTFNASLSTPEGGEIVNYTWDFGDENVTTVTSPVINHVYTTPGNYTVTLNVTDSEGLWDTESKSITVRGNPVAKFTYSPERPIMNEPVTFNASLSTSDGGTIVSYFWNYGDGTNGTGMIVEHTYTTTGNYTVTLTITDSEELTGTAQATFTVRGYPVATFTYSPALPLVGEVVTFNASLSTPDGANIVSYDWDFGDQTTGTGMIVNHTYTTFGNHTVTLTVTDSEDLSDTCSKPIRILIAPVANFTYSPTKPIVNEKVTFNATASYDPDRSIVSYMWDFGDGNVTVAGAVITHAYTAEETYNVTLTVTDDDGLTDTVWKLITVYTFLYVHDVAITSVTPSATEVYVGRIVNITVVAKNEGTAVETFSVTVYYNAISVGTQPVKDLLPDSETTLMFSWNTTDVTPANYTITAYATQVPGETETTDNTLVNGQVKVRFLGDVNGDGKVSSGDLLELLIALTLGKTVEEEPFADINSDGKISSGDLLELLIILSL